MNPAPLANHSFPPAVLEIARRLRDAGHDAHVVGGAVRDLLLGSEPDEYDLATSASATELLVLFERTVAVGAAFGVVQVRLGDRQFEVASFRRESGYADGRHPQRVQAGTLLEDAQRRDFRVNALYYDPIERRLLDPCRGLDDLQARRIAAISCVAFDWRHNSISKARAEPGKPCGRPPRS
jgi:tRNA nucleotidyltransferase/poly(A) polymerase